MIILKTKLVILFIVYLFFQLSINLVHPVTSLYVAQLELDSVYFGLFFAMMSLGQVVGALIWGFASDKIGRIGLISMGIIGYAAAQSLFGFVAFHPLIILIYRFMSGFFVAAPLTLFITYLVDISPKDNRMKYVMLFTCLQILGSSLGYKVGGYFFTKDYLTISGVFVLQIVVCIIVSLISFFVFRKQEKSLTQHSDSKKKYASLKDFKEIGVATLIFLITLTIVSIAQNNISKYLDIYVVDIGNTPDDLANIVLVSGMLGVLANLVMIPFLQKRIKEKYHIAFIVTIAISIVMLSLTFLPSSKYLMVLIYSPFMIYMMAKSVGTSMETSYLAKTAPKDKRGAILGVRQSFISLGSVIGPLIGSVLYQEEHRLWVFYFSILLFVFSFIILIFVTKIINKNNKKTSE